MIQLTPEEYASLRLQNATLKPGRGRHRKYLPHAFTEQGVAMLSSVLKSDRAFQVNIAIMRAFVRLREIVGNHKDLTARLGELERKVGSHDGQIQSLFEAIRQLLASPATKRRRIGFGTETLRFSLSRPSCLSSLFPPFPPFPPQTRLARPARPAHLVRLPFSRLSRVSRFSRAEAVPLFSLLPPPQAFGSICR
jgi:hypothetical protein